MVEDAGDRARETLGDLVQIPERQVRFIQLAVDENIVDDLLDQAPYPRRRGIVQDLRRSFHRIGEHDQRSLPTLGFGSEIAEILFIYGLHGWIFLLLCLAVEEGYEARPVMLPDDIEYPLRKPLLLCDLDTVLDVRREDQGTHARRQFLMPVVLGLLVLDEIFRFVDLSDVVV